MREFTENYRRTAVVIVPEEDTFAERQKLREEKDGNDIPDAAVLEMKGVYPIWKQVSYTMFVFLLKSLSFHVPTLLTLLWVFFSFFLRQFSII